MAEPLGWPTARAAEALARLLEGAGLAAPSRPPPGPGQESELEFAAWLRAHSSDRGGEVEPVDSDYPDAAAMLEAAGPALLRVGGEGPRVVPILRGRAGRVAIIEPEGRVVWVPTERLRAAVWADLEGAFQTRVAQLLDRVGVRG